jgi:hypothetical protein
MAHGDLGVGAALGYGFEARLSQIPSDTMISSIHNARVFRERIPTGFVPQIGDRRTVRWCLSRIAS